LVVGDADFLFPVTATTMAIKTSTSRTTPSQSAHRLWRGRFAWGAAGDGGLIPPASDDKVVTPWPAGPSGRKACLDCSQHPPGLHSMSGTTRPLEAQALRLLLLVGFLPGWLGVSQRRRERFVGLGRTPLVVFLVVRDRDWPWATAVDPERAGPTPGFAGTCFAGTCFAGTGTSGFGCEQTASSAVSPAI
jgi:hypothetical protein